MEKNAEEAIIATFEGLGAYCKFLTANDTTKTKSKQVGPCLNQKAEKILDRPKFQTRMSNANNVVLYRDVEVDFFYDYEKESRHKPQFLYYESKKEYRLTKIPHIDAKYVGALFILIKKEDKQYQVFILEKEKDKNFYLNTFGISPIENCFIIGENELADDEKKFINQYVEELNKKLEKNLPNTEEMSKTARNIFFKLNPAIPLEDAPDQKIMELIRIEYNLFKAFETSIYGDKVKNGFKSIEMFLFFAKKLLNSRKSRAGKSLELHLKFLFEKKRLKFDWQPSIDGKKKPDFLFPSKDAYELAEKENNQTSNVIFLAVKTTCKDRWRQIESEAKSQFLKNGIKYLCTLEKGITEDQLKEMKEAKVFLVVPESLIELYPEEYKTQISTLEEFIKMVENAQKVQQSKT